ncbi:aspartyl/asparaginyl beta-hydroxylase domain-containing protein [Botrimarina sp.]|uniref:aspartyl/asparaginyl beta-hydroxylase domain-containing protein n=1 Tax=Botrimarina sp. TaxID=2795802 RepID=UPI0032EC3A33
MGALQQLANRWFWKGVGGDSRPVVYDIDATYPALRRLEAPDALAAIRGELAGILPDRDDIPRYHELDPGRSHISSDADGEASWRVFMLYAMGAKPEQNRRRCPETCRLLDEIPDLFQAFFSILEPHKSVPPHESPYAGYLRYHLPLIVPTDNPPRMRVKDYWHTWKEGQGLLFCDYWEHEVENHSDQVRVVLIVDLFRPMPPARDWVNRLVTRTVLKRRYGKKIAAGQQPDL